MSCSTKQEDASTQDQAALEKEEDYIAFNKAADQEENQEAYLFAQKLTVRFPKNGSAWNALGYSAERLEKYTEAKKAYLQAVKVNPNHAKAWYNLGVCWGRLHRFSEEIRCYKKALLLRPNYAKAWFNLSIAYTETKKFKEALAAYQRSIALDPGLINQQVLLVNPPPTDIQHWDIFSDTPSQTAQNIISPVPKIENKAVLVEKFHFSNEKLPSLKWNDTSLMQFSLSEVNSSLLFQFQSRSFVPNQNHSEINGLSNAEIEAQQWNNLGVSQDKKQQWDTAIYSYRQALQVLRRDPMVWNNLGIAQLSAGYFSDAIISFKESLKFSNEKNLVKRNLAIAYLEMGYAFAREKKDVEAVCQLNETLQLDSNFVEARFKLISVLQRNQHWQEVVNQYEILARQLPNSGDIWYGLGIARIKTDQIKTAVEALSLASRWKPNTPDIWHWCGVGQGMLQQYKAAVVSLRRSVQLYAQDGWAWYNLGLAYAYVQNWPEAISALKTAAVLLRDRFEPHQLLAAVYLVSDQPRLSASLCEQLLQKHKDRVLLWKIVGESYMRLKEWNKAVAAYRNAVEIEPHDGEAWVGLGQVFAETIQNKEACIAYQRAVSLGYKDGEIWNNLGVVHARIGEYQEALNAFAEASKFLKNDAELLVSIGAVFHCLDRELEVQRTFKLLQKINSHKAAELEEFCRRNK